MPSRSKKLSRKKASKKKEAAVEKPAEQKPAEQKSTGMSSTAAVFVPSSPSKNVPSSPLQKSAEPFVPVEQPKAVTPSSKVTEIVPSAPKGEHPLQTAWTLYYDKKMGTYSGDNPDEQKPTSTDVTYDQYENNLRKLGTFNTVEGFWRHYAWMQDPVEIPRDHDVFLIRHGYVPAWETFPNGGIWIVKVRKGNGVISRLWEELLFACIGELFAEPDVVCVELSSRRTSDKLSVWNMDNTNPAVKLSIGEKLRELLNLDESTKVEYKDFKKAIKDGSAFRNAKKYVYAAQGAYISPGYPMP